MTEEQKTSDGVMWGRLSEVERQSASHTTELRSIYAGLDEIRDVLVRIQENSKPNIGGMFLILLATCTFFVTVGGLSLAPVYRDLSRLYEAQHIMSSDQAANHKNRFTSHDGRALEDKLENVIDNRHQRLVGKLHDNEDAINDNRDRISQIEGYLKGKDL